MKQRPLRFVHAADFHLDQPLTGVTHVPDHLASLFLDASQQAAERVFDTVLDEQADFLLLSGDILKIRTGGGRAADFLWRQFQRLYEHHIPVYWCDSGHDEIEQWPSAVPLPANVRTFSSEHVERVTFTRGRRRPVAIYALGTARPGTFAWSDFQHTGDAYAVAMTHCAQTETPKQFDPSINYWALGGAHQRYEIPAPGTTVYVVGTPQGRCPDEPGPHGCSVVDVDARGMSRRHFVVTDVLRWHDELIELPDQLDANGLVRLLRDRAASLAELAGSRELLVRWQVIDGDQIKDTRSDVLAARLRQGELAGEILQTLRQEFGMSVPGVWSISLEIMPPVVLPSGWYEEDTVLGDLLRRIQQLQEDPQLEVALEPLSARHTFPDDVVQRLRRVDPGLRDHLLRRVAVLGVDVLRGDRVLVEE